MIYDFAYWLHIVSYLAWLIAFAASLFYGIQIRLAEDVVSKHKFMRSERLATSIGAHVGALGILISGVVMTLGPQWEWFDVQLYPWLALKQLLFLVILILVGFSIKRSVAFKKILRQEDTNTEISQKWNKAYRMSMVIYILVVINTYLGLMKPGLG